MTASAGGAPGAVGGTTATAGMPGLGGRIAMAGGAPGRGGGTTATLGASGWASGKAAATFEGAISATDMVVASNGTVARFIGRSFRLLGRGLLEGDVTALR